MQCCTISATQQSDPVTHISKFSFSYIFHHGLYQETGYSSLCYTGGPHCPSILNIIVCIYEPQTHSPSYSLPSPPWQPQVCSLCLWVSFCFVDWFICAIFQITHISDIIWFVFLLLTSLSLRISSCIHVAVNNIIFIFIFLFL